MPTPLNKARPIKVRPQTERATEHKIALTVETQTAQTTIALKTASAMPAEHKARPNYRAPELTPELQRTPNKAQPKDAPKTQAFPPFL